MSDDAEKRDEPESGVVIGGAAMPLVAAPRPAKTSGRARSDPSDGHDATSTTIRKRTFLVMSLVTIGFAVFTGVVLVLPYFTLSSAVLNEQGIDRGCAIHLLTHLFHAFCIYSVRFLGALSGGVIALSGALFILNRLQGDVGFAGEPTQGFKLSFQTASPGLAMVLFGAMLMVAAMFREQTFTPPSIVCARTGVVSSPTEEAPQQTPIVAPDLPEGDLPELDDGGDVDAGAHVEGEP